MPALEQRHCRHASTALSMELLQDFLAQLPDWRVADDGKSIWRRYRFKNYEQTLGFANAAAETARTEDHHPDIRFGYNYCEVHYSTHSVGGLSENDVICAARTDALLART